MKKIVCGLAAAVILMTLSGCTQPHNDFVLPAETQGTADGENDNKNDDNGGEAEKKDDIQNDAKDDIKDAVTIKAFESTKAFRDTLLASPAVEGQDREQIEKQGYYEAEIGRVPLEFRKLKGISFGVKVTKAEWNSENGKYTLYYTGNSICYAFTPETNEEELIESMNKQLDDLKLSYEAILASENYTDVRKNDLYYGLGYECLYDSSDGKEYRLVHRRFGNRINGGECLLVKLYDHDGKLNVCKLFAINGENSFEVTFGGFADLKNERFFDIALLSDYRPMICTTEEDPDNKEKDRVDDGYGVSPVWKTFGSLKEAVDHYENELKDNILKDEWGDYKFRRLEGISEDFFDHMVEYNIVTGEYSIGYRSERSDMHLSVDFFADGEKTEEFFENYIFDNTYEGLLENELIFDIKKTEASFEYGTGYECLYSTKVKTNLKIVYNEYTDEKTGVKYICSGKYLDDGTCRTIYVMVLDGEDSFFVMISDAADFSMEDAIKLRAAVIE